MKPIRPLQGEYDITIKGPCGLLEAFAFQSTCPAGFAVVCHPHPLFSGNMHNKVVTTCIKACQSLYLNTTRFNFRSVGMSHGKYDNGIGEQDDCIAVWRWTDRQMCISERPSKSVLIGFSFGALVAYQCLRTLSPDICILIAPPSQKLAPVDYAGQLNIVLPEQDELFSLNDQTTWLKQHHPKASVTVVSDASHFFHGKLSQLAGFIQEAVGSPLS